MLGNPSLFSTGTDFSEEDASPFLRPVCNSGGILPTSMKGSDVDTFAYIQILYSYLLQESNTNDEQSP